MDPNRSVLDDETIEEPPSPPPAYQPITTSPHIDEAQERKRINRHAATLGSLDAAKYRARARRARFNELYDNDAETTVEPPTPQPLRAPTMLLPPHDDQSSHDRRRSAISPSSVIASLEEVGAMFESQNRPRAEFDRKHASVQMPSSTDASRIGKENRTDRAVRGREILGLPRNNYRTNNNAVVFDPSVEYIPPRANSASQNLDDGYTTSTDGSPWSEAAVTVGSRSLLSQTGQSVSTLGLGSARGGMTRSTNSFINHKRMINGLDGPGRVEFEDTEDEQPVNDAANFRRQVQSFHHHSTSMRHIPSSENSMSPSSNNTVAVVATPVFDVFDVCRDETRRRNIKYCKDWRVLVLMFAVVAIAVLSTALVTRGGSSNASIEANVTPQSPQAAPEPQGVPEVSNSDAEYSSFQFSYVMGLVFSSDKVVDEAAWLSATTAYLTGVLSKELNDFVSLSLTIQKLDLRRKNREIRRRARQSRSATFFGVVELDEDSSDSRLPSGTIQNVVNEAFTKDDLSGYVDSLEGDGVDISSIWITNEDGTSTISNTPVEITNPSDGLSENGPGDISSGFDFVQPPTQEPTDSPPSDPISGPSFGSGGFFLNLPTARPTDFGIPILDPVPISFRGFFINFPTSESTSLPTQAPTVSADPTSTPSTIPTLKPTGASTLRPTCGGRHRRTPSPNNGLERTHGEIVIETGSPSNLPTSSPTTSPTTSSPSYKPSQSPSQGMTTSPSTRPTKPPTQPPTSSPTKIPSQDPTSTPTEQPTNSPTAKKTYSPSNLKQRVSQVPTSSPTPVTDEAPSLPPTELPSSSPITKPPTNAPTQLLSFSPSKDPTSSPTNSPTTKPSTNAPTPVHSFSPSKDPTSLPTKSPTESPTVVPTYSLSKDPTSSPTKPPTNAPTPVHSFSPSKDPTSSPTTKSPTESPTVMPTYSLSKDPTSSPTKSPTNAPTPVHSFSPSKDPTSSPTTKPPTELPTVTPTYSPSKDPTSLPTIGSSATPSRQPTHSPTKQPTDTPTKPPTPAPTEQRTDSPTTKPALSPVEQLTPAPRDQPTRVLKTSMNYKWEKSGAIFDVVATESVKITSIAVHVDTKDRNIPIEIYTLEGSYTSGTQWELQQKTTIPEGQGPQTLSPVPSASFSPIEIPAGVRMGIYVALKDRHMLVGQGYDVFQDSALKIELGQSVNAYPYQGIKDGSVWNGALSYELV